MPSLCSTRVNNIQGRVPAACLSASCSTTQPSHDHSFWAESLPFPAHWANSYLSFETHFEGTETKKPRSHSSPAAPTVHHQVPWLYLSNLSPLPPPYSPTDSPRHPSPRYGPLYVPSTGLNVSQTDLVSFFQQSYGPCLRDNRNEGMQIHR